MTLSRVFVRVKARARTSEVCITRALAPWRQRLPPPNWPWVFFLSRLYQSCLVGGCNTVRNIGLSGLSECPFLPYDLIECGLLGADPCGIVLFNDLSSRSVIASGSALRDLPVARNRRSPFE